MSKHPKSIQRSRRISLIWRWVLAVVLVTFSIFPVLWIISASINPVNDLANQKLIPDNWGFQNFQQLVTNPIFPFFTWLKNSLIVSTISTLLTLSLTTLAAFAFSRFRFKGRQGLLKAILLIQSFPNLLAIVALFTIVKQIGDVVPWLGLNTHAGLILVYSGGAMGMNIWLMKGYMDTIPRDIDESAHVDGATDWQVFWKLILPLLRPILVVISILSFIGTYGEFIIARTLLTQREMQTVMVGLQIFTAGQYTKNWGVFAAGALIAALPIMIIYLILQDQIVGGLTQGSVKG
ncbi:MAG: sugar ABC transporter permease [Anaerolineaceae bacterium]|mgnify:FL=1|jgi:ABC-type maltose transport system permease subunit|nr:sugar ABC transporter permease [Anaerolineaceae bacterium]MDD4042478.1 sugar ABC transporter permease [Anaerolineaceae bacterium]MDD4578523.1 sugar ABC transporter permease [Anaerolineaceae bacterium]